MQWIMDNWVILLLVGGMLAMHLFGHGHGGHGGGHGGHGRGRRNKSDEHAGHENEPRDTRTVPIDEETSPAPERPADDGRA